MKLKTLFPFAAALVIPLFFVSCGDDKKEDDKEKKEAGGAGGSAEASSHKEVGTKVSAVMNDIFSTMGEIKDLDSAKAFATKAPGWGEELKSLVAQAKKLDPPTDEEKKEVKAMKDQSDLVRAEAMDTFGAFMQQSADAQAISTIMKEAQPAGMEESTKELKEIYDLSDGPSGEEPAKPE